jgi:hypothetical protein
VTSLVEDNEEPAHPATWSLVGVGLAVSDILTGLSKEHPEHDPVALELAREKIEDGLADALKAIAATKKPLKERQ